MALDPNRWTIKTQEAFTQATEAARANSNPEVTPDHLLAALLRQEEGVVLPILNRVGTQPLSARNAADEAVAKLPKSYGTDVRLSRETQQTLDTADQARAEMGDEYLSTEHLLLALADRLGVKREDLLTALREVRGSHRVTSQNPEEQYQALEKYGRDLTEEARKGKLDPVIGRDDEIRRVIQVLSRRTKNNPVLKEITDSGGEVITFIDELHTVVGAGAAEGAMDAGNMLKPMLARGELRMIGATTLDEYRERIEKDAALERRFQQVFVGEPSVEDTIAILRGLKGRYEAHHKVQISDAALVAAATLSDRYITARFLPDKAIDLIDEAASRLRMEIDSRPVEIDELQRSVDRMKMEEMALERENDPASKERLERLRADLADRQEQLTALVARWEREKAGLNKVGELKQRLDDLRGQAERAQRDADFETASRLMYGQIPALEAELAEASALAAEEASAGGPAGDGQADAAEGPGDAPMVKEEVGPDDVADVVSSWTGIPAGRLLEGETGKLLRMEAELGKRLIGQSKAVAVVSDAVRRTRAGVADPDRPTGSFLFL